METNTKRIEHPNLASKVYELLKDDIRNNRLAPGSRINIQQFAAENGVSKTPMREALVRLQNEGYVVNIPRGGTYVREFSEKEIKDIYELRQALEALAGRLAAAHISAGQVEEMTEACTAYSEAIDRRDISQCVEHDLRFHRILAEASGNTRLMDLMAEIRQRVEVLISRGEDYWQRADASLADHQAVRDALAAGDGETAAEVLSEHVRRGKEALFD